MPGLLKISSGLCTSVTYEYRAYGLAVSSTRPLPWFRQTHLRKRPDVVVRLGELPRGFRPERIALRQPWYICPDLGPQGTPWLKIWSVSEAGYFFFCWSDGTQFVVDSQGRELWAAWPPALKEEDVIPVYVTGNMMSFILRLRGYVCLHASAVVVDGEALLIGGQHGSGKSTLAAAFAQAGYPVLSDDVAALKWHRNRVMVFPSFPRIGLWPESAEGLFGPVNNLPRLWPDEAKRFVRLGRGPFSFPSTPAPLGAIYTLADRLPPGMSPRIEPAAGAQAVLALVAGTFGVLLPGNDARAAEFRLKVRAAERPVRRLHRSFDLSRIEELREAIVQDFRSLGSRRERLPKPIPFRMRAAPAAR